MKFTGQVLFAGISVLWEKYGYSGLWDSFHWKLDPYIVPKVTGQSELIRISNSRVNNQVIHPVELLFKAKSGFFQRQVYRTQDGGTLWCYVEHQGNILHISYLVNSRWNIITLLEDHTNSAGHLAFEYLGQMMPCVLLAHQVLTFHGVLMEHEGRGIILSAFSGTGKTTHARLWRDHKRALIINGDRVTCRKVDGVWTGFGLPWSGTSGEQINRSVPLTALVVLERGNQNAAHYITGLEAFGAAWPHIQFPNWDAELTGNALELANEFLSQIPVIRLQCRPDLNSVEVLNQALEGL